MKQNRGHGLTQQWSQKTILDQDTWQTWGLNNNEQAIIQWKDMWQDHMTNRESH